MQRLKLIAVAILTTSWLGCQSRTIDNSSVVGPERSVSFLEDVQPIFDSSCAGSGCHIPASSSGVRLSSYEAVMSSRGAQYGRPIVSPGDPAESPLVDKLFPNPEFGSRMPLNRAVLTSRQITLISTWIEEGARDN